MNKNENEPRPAKVEKEKGDRAELWLLDDDRATRKIVEQSASLNSRLYVRSFADGESLVSEFKQVTTNGRLPDILILDYTLSADDGYETGVKLLKILSDKYPDEINQVRLYGHTGNEGAKKEFIRAGAEKVLIKPSRDLSTFLFGDSDEI